MTNQNSISDELKFAIRAAKEAGEIISNHFDPCNIKFFDKSKGNLKSEVDHLIGDKIYGIFSERFPDYKFYCEDFGSKGILRGEVFTKNDKIWVIDPIDGTSNFNISIPYFSTSISLMQNDEILLAVIFNPIMDELHYATKCRGAFRNGEKLSIKKEQNFSKPIISLMCGYSSKREKQIINKELSPYCFRILENWAPSLDFCLLARGKIDGIISINSEIEDQICGLLIAKESGANIINLQGEDLVVTFSEHTPPFITAKSGELCLKLLRHIERLEINR